MNDELNKIMEWLHNDLAFRAPEDIEGRNLQIGAALQRAYSAGYDEGYVHGITEPAESEL